MSWATWCQFVPLLMMLTGTTWLKAYLPSFSTLKVVFSPLYCILWKNILRLCEYPAVLNLSYTDRFNVHVWLLLDSIINMMVDKWCFSNCIPSIFTSWLFTCHPTHFYLPIYLHLLSIHPPIYFSLDSWILIIWWSHGPVLAKRSSFNQVPLSSWHFLIIFEQSLSAPQDVPGSSCTLCPSSGIRFFSW